MKKAMNILGIIAAWILSIVLVLMLVLAPTVLSLLSMLETQTITDVFFAFVSPKSAAPEVLAPGERLIADAAVPLAEEPEASGSTNIGLGDLGELVTPEMLKEMFGTEVDQATLNEILQSDTVKEFVETYTEDFANVIIGKDETMQFDADKLQAFVDEHLDEIVDIVEKISPEGEKIDRDEIKQKIRDAVQQNADEIINALPKPEEVRDGLLEENSEIQPLMDFLKNKDTYAAIVVAVIVVLCVLVFLVRLPGLRGLRWLAIDLFIAVPLNGVIGCVLYFSPQLLLELAGAQDAVYEIIVMLIRDFAGGVLVRTGIMLAAGIALLVAYIFIKKARKKKALTQQAQPELPAEPAQEPAAEESEAEAPAEEPVQASAPEEAAQITE